MSVDKAKLSYTLVEAAEATGMAVHTLRKLHNEGLLPFRYPTSKPVIRAADLNALLDNAPTESPTVRRVS